MLFVLENRFFSDTTFLRVRVQPQTMRSGKSQKPAVGLIKKNTFSGFPEILGIIQCIYMYIIVTSTLTYNVHSSSSAEFMYFFRARVDRSIGSDGYTSILLQIKYTKMNVADNSFSQATNS